MKILVISDTHRKIGNVIKLMDFSKDFDRIIHLGDLVVDAQDLESIYPRIPIDYVAGNCDFLEPGVPKEKLLNLYGKKILITHGHGYDVKRSYDGLAHVAMERQVDAVLFGHTHIPYMGYLKDMLIMNPGSISQPKNGEHPSFALLEMDEKGKLHGTLSQFKKI